MIGLVLAAAGSGSRFGSQTPKQFAEIDGMPVFVRALRPFLPFCRQAVVVVPQNRMQLMESCLDELDSPCRVDMTGGGTRRQDSVYRGLLKLQPEIRTVLVHDAARPFCSAELIARVVEGARQHGACIPVLPISDTVKQIDQGKVSRTLDRSQLGLAQTPQGFDRRLLLKAFEHARREGIEATDESSLVEQMEGDVYTVPGEAANRKITWKEDL